MVDKYKLLKNKTEAEAKKELSSEGVQLMDSLMTYWKTLNLRRAAVIFLIDTDTGIVYDIMNTDRDAAREMIRIWLADEDKRREVENDRSKPN